MSTEFYKDKVQQLQQKVDEQYEMIKHLKNELLLCKESYEWLLNLELNHVKCAKKIK